MEQLKNYLPVIIFVAVYAATDIYKATAALMIAVAAQVGLYWLLKKPISMELKLTFWVGLVAGSLTLFFRNELFIQWKTTVVNWLLACGLITTHFFGKSYGTEVVLKAILANAAEKQVEKQSEKQSEPQADSLTADAGTDAAEDAKLVSTPETKAPATGENRVVWRNVNFLWIGSFTVAGALNLLVAYTTSLDFWVTYKLVGGMSLTFTTVVLTMIYLYKKGLLDDLVPEEIDEQQEAP